MLNILIQEITIQQCLNHASEDAHPDQFPVQEVSVDPGEDIEQAVRTQSEEVVGSKCVVSLGVLQQEDLGEDGDRLQVLAKGPKDGAELMKGLAVEQQSKNHAGNDQVAEAEGVVVSVVCCSPGVLVTHQVADEVARGQEEELHNGVVEGDEGNEEVEVAGGEDDGVEELSSKGDAGSGLLADHFAKEDDDCCKVQHICNEAEEIHIFFK